MRLQHGAGIVAAPPSRHEKDRSFQYAWSGCDETVIRDLPKFNFKALETILNRAVAVLAGTQAELKAKAGFRDGSSKLALNDYLCGHGTWCDTADELLALAHDWNESLPEMLIDKLNEVEVMQVVQGVWRDVQSGKLQRFHGRKAAELPKLIMAQRNGLYALGLFEVLRGEHSARCARGETFAITPKAMAKAGSVPGFTRGAIEKGRRRAGGTRFA